MLLQPQVEIVRIRRVIARQPAVAAPVFKIEGTEASGLDGLPAGDVHADVVGDALRVELTEAVPVVEVRERNTLQRLPGERDAAAGGIATEDARRRNASGAHAIQQG